MKQSEIVRFLHLFKVQNYVEGLKTMSMGMFWGGEQKFLFELLNQYVYQNWHKNLYLHSLK